MNIPLVSIVIPCFNAAAYVEDAVESALRQTYKKVEVIVVDDGSTDESLQVLTRFGNSIRLLPQENFGACHARNVGIKHARGELIQFLDADDLMHHRKIEATLQATDSHTVLFCDCQRVSKLTGSIIKEKHGALNGDFASMALIGIQTSAPLHRKTFLEKVGGFDETLPCAQEYDLHLRMLVSGMKFLRVPETLITLREVPNSVSSNYVRVMLQWEKIISRAVRMIDSADPEREHKQQVLSGVLARAASHLAARGETAASRRFFTLSQQIHPRGSEIVFSGSRAAIYRVFGFPLGQQLIALIKGKD